MRFRTSYFARLRMEGAVNPVSICAWPPRGSRIPNYPRLAPPQGLLRRFKAGTADIAQYTEEYEAMLAGLDPMQVLMDLRALTGAAEDEDITLVCFEKDGEFCHRHLARAWLHRELGRCAGDSG